MLEFLETHSEEATIAITYIILLLWAYWTIIKVKRTDPWARDHSRKRNKNC